MSRCQRGLTEAIVAFLRAHGESSSTEIFEALEAGGWDNGHSFRTRISALLANRRLRGLMESRRDRVDGRRVYWRLPGMAPTRALASKQYGESPDEGAIAAAATVFISPGLAERTARAEP